MAFREALDKLAWTDGCNIQIEYRWRAGEERVRASVAEIVSLAPVILAEDSPL